MQAVKRHVVSLFAAIALLSAAASEAQEGPSLLVGGTSYTKFLAGSMRDQGALYNFTTVPGEGYGDTGQGSEVELLLNAKLSRQVEVKARLHSRFSQNFWTNFGGFGGDPTKDCVAGNCGEFDPRSDQYVKLRGVAVTLTPGYQWVDAITVGANDFGQFDPYVVGRYRYIDRDNAAGVLFQGSALQRKFSYDLARISLPRLFGGPGFSSGDLHAADASYVLQSKYQHDKFDVAGLFNFVNDIEIDALDRNLDNGRSVRTRFHNNVWGLKGGVHLDPRFDVRGSFYYSIAQSADDLAPKDFFGLSGFSPVPVGTHKDMSYKVNLDMNDPLGIGLSLFVEGFSIGADYVSLMAARREADVLLTEGHDATFAFPGPSNAKFGVFKGNPSAIGYGGWSGTAQQVATVNVDNEFTDFDEPMAETVIGWQGVTVNPVLNQGPLELTGEYTFLTYDTNWQAWGDDSRPVTASPYPSSELDSGVGHNFRSAYAPFQDKRTHILAARGKYVVEQVGTGLELFGKVKYIAEQDKRLNDPKYLPYQAGDCPGAPNPCANNQNLYNGTNSTADIYGNPGLVTVDGQTGYQWKPFDNIADDDRDLSYLMFHLGAGYQLTEDLYASLIYAKYFADLKDGNTALQGYNLHEMASGHHDKNQLAVRAKYNLAGAEFGLEYQYNWGTFTPDFGTGFVPQVADATIAADHNVPEGSPGFTGRYGGWNSLMTRQFSQHRMKAFLKVQF